MENYKTLCCLVTFAGFILCLSFAGSAYAAAEPLERQYRTSLDGEGALTPKMIRSCISLKKKLDKKLGEATGVKEQLEKMDAELKLAEESLLEDEKKMDKSDQKAIDEYNSRLETFRERVAEYQKKVAEYNTMIAPYATLENKYTSRCVDQPYYDDDYEQAKKAMGYGLE